MFGWTSETWKALGKYGLATVFASLLLAFFMKHFDRQAMQLNELHETNKGIAVTNEKVANAVTTLSGTNKDMAEEVDDVGDALRIMAEHNKNQLEYSRLILEKIEDVRSVNPEDP